MPLSSQDIKEAREAVTASKRWTPETQEPDPTDLKAYTCLDLEMGATDELDKLYRRIMDSDQLGGKISFTKLNLNVPKGVRLTDRLYAMMFLTGQITQQSASYYGMDMNGLGYPMRCPSRVPFGKGFFLNGIPGVIVDAAGHYNAMMGEDGAERLTTDLYEPGMADCWEMLNPAGIPTLPMVLLTTPRAREKQGKRTDAELAALDIKVYRMNGRLHMKKIQPTKSIGENNKPSSKDPTQMKKANDLLPDANGAEAERMNGSPFAKILAEKEKLSAMNSLNFDRLIEEDIARTTPTVKSLGSGRLSEKESARTTPTVESLGGRPAKRLKTPLRLDLDKTINEISCKDYDCQHSWATNEEPATESTPDRFSTSFTMPRLTASIKASSEASPGFSLKPPSLGPPSLGTSSLEQPSRQRPSWMSQASIVSGFGHFMADRYRESLLDREESFATTLESLEAVMDHIEASEGQPLIKTLEDVWGHLSAMADAVRIKMGQEEPTDEKLLGEWQQLQAEKKRSSD